MKGCLYIKNSLNRKISGSNLIDATYLSIERSCPRSCPLKGKGCYAFDYPLCLHIRRLDNEAKYFSAIKIAEIEAKLIRESYNGIIPCNRILRLHVSGDSRTITGSKIINCACGEWLSRCKDGKIYSYTHCWQNIPRQIWNYVSMLASVDSIDQVYYARQNGYAPAIVVAEHLSDKSYYIPGSDTKFIACPAQTKDNVACSDCLLCTKANYLYDKNMGISFSAHGIKKNLIKERLKK